MLSGIGPAAELSRLKIPLVNELKGVGANLLDHPQVLVRFRTKPRAGTQFLVSPGFINTLKFMKALAEYYLRGRGPLTMTVGILFTLRTATDFIHCL
jgi:choline dehydrogenase